MTVFLTLLACGSVPSTAADVDPLANSSRVATLPFYDSAEFTPRWHQPNELPADFHHIPDFALTNQHGEAVTQAEMDGQITIVNFFFASCTGICPRLSEAMLRVDHELAQDGILLLSHSVTPDTDTPEVLSKFAAEKGIDSERWYLLTGDQTLIYSLGRASYFVEEDLGEKKGLTEFLHTENIVLVDGDRHIRGIYNGLNRASVTQLIADVGTLRSHKEFSQSATVLPRHHPPT
ncbi:MAG: protein SCO1/2 [Cognaticolwellia sp.]|jgi:protein SCO1/2